jgi:hypothetical protein
MFVKRNGAEVVPSCDQLPTNGLANRLHEGRHPRSLGPFRAGGSAGRGGWEADSERSRYRVSQSGIVGRVRASQCTEKCYINSGNGRGQT